MDDGDKIEMCKLIQNNHILTAESFQVENEAYIKDSLGGYQHWWCISSWWPEIMKSPFFAWFSQNWDLTLNASSTAWGIGIYHVQRETSYKGDQRKTSEMVELISAPWPLASSLGCVWLLGTLAGVKSLAAKCQENCLRFLGVMFGSIQEETWSFAFLPGKIVKVTHKIMMSMEEFFHTLENDAMKTEIKARLGEVIRDITGSKLV